MGNTANSENRNSKNLQEGDTHTRESNWEPMRRGTGKKQEKERPKTGEKWDEPRNQKREDKQNEKHKLKTVKALGTNNKPVGT